MSPRAFSVPRLLVLLATLLLRLSTCSPITPNRHHVIEDLPITKPQKRQGGFFSVLGVAGLAGAALHPRLEIRELEKNADQWNVYLLGLRRFQSVDQSDKLSYYQVAGIHGRPFIAWDGVNPGPGGDIGYCHHGSNIFPTWHRPYLALFEELLYLNARQAISEFPRGALKDRYLAALSSFRMPYWDWAATPPSGESLLPSSVQRPTIEVVLPNGTATVPNPLFAYTFHPLSSTDFESGWLKYPTTLRDPSSEDSNAASRNDLVALALNSSRLNIQSRVYGVLATEHDYAGISNDLVPGESIESIHDTIHNLLGSDGHMSMLAYSAFDPIFWLHHTNVDRIFAIWQQLNPDSYVTPFSNPYATFTTPNGAIADVNTPLEPFHRNDEGEFWTSETVRSPHTFAYTYPELLNLNNTNDTSSLISRVNALYGPNAQFHSTKRSSISPPFESRGIAGAPNFSGRRKYTANIKVRKFGLDGSFNVYIFLGNEPIISDPQHWVREESFVGLTGILSQSRGSMGAASDSLNLDIEANGAVPLTAVLEDRVRMGELESLREDVVARHLRRRLRWRVSKMNGEQIPVESVPGLQISVRWVEIEPARSENEFPNVVGEEGTLVQATDGLVGGFASGDGF